MELYCAANSLYLFKTISYVLWLHVVFFFFIYFADRASQYIYLNINQLDALNFIMRHEINSL